MHLTILMELLQFFQNFQEELETGYRTQSITGWGKGKDQHNYIPRRKKVLCKK